MDIRNTTDDQAFKFQVSTDGGTNYNKITTSTIFESGHNEANTWYSLTYVTGEDQPSGTAFQSIGFSQGSAGSTDGSGVGELHLYNPSSTTYVKNYWATYQQMGNAPSTVYFRLGGFFDTTDAVNAIQFKFSSGVHDGHYRMYGIK